MTLKKTKLAMSLHQQNFIWLLLLAVFVDISDASRWVPTPPVLASIPSIPDHHDHPGCLFGSGKKTSHLFKLAADSKTFYVDVRSEKEVESPPFLLRKFANIPVTLTDASAINKAVEKNRLPSDKHTAIIVFSNFSGFRARNAKNALEKAGYDNVTNGGGIRDVNAACNKQKRGLHWRCKDLCSRVGTGVHKE